MSSIHHHTIRQARLLFAVCLLLFAVTSCVDYDDATQPVTATIQLVRPADFDSSADLSGMTVTLQSAEVTLTVNTDVEGKAVVQDMAPGTYDISVSAELTAAQYAHYTGKSVGGQMGFTLTGTSNRQVITSDDTVTLQLEVFPNETLIISKVYSSNSKIQGGSFSTGKYIELYNNSNAPVDAAGLYIGLLESESTIAYQVYPTAVTPDTLHLKQVFRIPADSTVTVAPGASLLLVNSAVDNSSQNAYESDLRGADFEAKDINLKIPNNDDVPALELIYSTYSMISCMNLMQGGPTGIVIFRTDDDVRLWPTVYANGKTKGNMFLCMPAGIVLDGVDIVKNKAQTGPDFNTKRLFTDIDATYACVNSAAGTTGERLVRRTLSVTADGRKILQDTNNSVADFVCTDTISPRNYLEP